ncbi:MAG: hypothetical protein QNJ47_04920 [Nostocaceae cyanobacterium]|nr:hypothetical protein [Nostocaceae cyanobacterium]
MANHNNLVDTVWHKLQQDSVSWGSLILWICGLAVLLAMVTMFSAV